ncbi:MAG: hypothetical protein ACRD2I_07835 [Vicinamibacterales bacterium]
MTLLLALALQPEELSDLPSNPLSEGDLLLIAAFVLLIAGVLGFDMVRTWWDTNKWRRDARRRRRHLR